jgi:hypothetical protein
MVTAVRPPIGSGIPSSPTASGWRTESGELLKLVEVLQASLSEAEAERTSLTQSLDSLTAWQAQSSAAHAQEIAAIRSVLEVEISRIEKERDKARKATQGWRAAAFLGLGSGIGVILGRKIGFVLGGTVGSFLAFIIRV